MRYKIFLLIILLISLFLHLNSSYDLNSISSYDISTYDLCYLTGYIILDCTNAYGDVKGEYGEIIKLYNGMIFELNESNYIISLGDPEVVIFGNLIEHEGKEYILYKLAIEDELFDATRIR
ncbi:MAG: hypothetical protein ACTSQG_11505 [Promethearchaeota archaeon]